MPQRLPRKFFTIAIFLINLGISFGQVRSAPIQVLDQRIKLAIEKYVHQNFGLTKGEVVIESHPFNATLENQNLNGEIKILPTRDKIRKGNQILKCGYFQKGKLIRTINLRVNIRTFETIVVSKRALPRQTILKKEHLTFDRRETTKVLRKFYTSMDELLALRTKRFIQLGEIITENMVEPPPLISRGKQVNIHFIKDTLEIIVPGLARQDGYLGENIRVRCLETNKNFKAKVVDSNKVIVNLL
jgi:flagella basal body P-ring formation protein FlgA